MPHRRLRLARIPLALIAAGVTPSLWAQGTTRVTVSGLTDAGAAAAGLTTIVGSGRAALRTESPRDAPTLEQGWPVTLPSNPTYQIDPYRGVALADLDLDGRLEVIRPSTDGNVYVFRHDGTALPGWPQRTVGYCQEAPTVADLDGDGTPELLVNTRGLTDGGRCYVFRGDGTLAPGWPKVLGNHNLAGAPVAADLDADGLLEVILQERAAPVGVVHVFRHDGARFPGSWPYLLDHVPAGTPAVGDLDGDGAPEIVCISYRSMHVVATDGTPRRGFPYDVQTRHAANYSYQSPALADLDGDGYLEIVSACHQSGGGCYVFRHDGTLQPGWPKTFGAWTYCPPSIADVDGDGALDIVCGRAGGAAPGGALYAWRADGVLLPGFPVVHPGGAEAPPAVVDLDDDGVMEIVYDSNLQDAAGRGWLHCVDAYGVADPGFPLRPLGFTHLNGAQFADVDADGRLEMVVVSRANQTVTIALYEPAATSRLAHTAWATYHQGDARRGLVGDQRRFEVVGDATPGGGLRFEMHAPAGRLFAILVGPSPALVAVPGLGHLRIGGAVVDVHRTVIGPERRALHTLPIPNLAALRGARLVFQGLTADLGTAAELQGARTVVVR